MSFFKGFPRFTNSERKGLIVLIALMLVLILYIFFSKKLVSQVGISADEFDDLKSAFSTESEDSITKNQQPSVRKKTKTPAVLEKFDPNTTDASQWMKMGLSEKQARVVINYRNKYGPFKSKTDVQKVIVISDEFYNRIEPYIEIAPVTETTRILHLNTATQEELEEIPGLGPKLSKGIVVVREKLGGYVDYNQLLLVYYMKPETIEKIKPYLILDTGNVQPIDLNTCKPGRLFGHPFIKDWDVVNQIMNEKENFGPYLNWEDFRARLNFPDSFYVKMKPYIIFKNGIE